MNAQTVSTTRYQQISLAAASARRRSTSAREGGTISSAGCASGARSMTSTSVPFVLVVDPTASSLEDREYDDARYQDQDPREPRGVPEAAVSEALRPQV